MSSDEEVAIIGRIMLENKALSQRNAIIHEEVHRITNGLKALADRLISGHSMFMSYKLSSEDIALLDVTKLNDLLNERAAIAKRHAEISETLKRAGL